MKIKKNLYNFFTKHYNIIVLVFSGCMMLMLIMMGTYYAFYSKSVKKNELMSIEQTVEQVANNVDNTLSSVKFTMEFMSTNDMVLDQIIYNNDGGYEDQIEKLNEAWNMALTVENYRYIYGVKFYIDDRKAISKEHLNYFGWSNAESELWYAALMSKKSGVMWLPPYKDKTVSAENNTSEVFSYISTVKNYKDSITEPVAIIKLDCESREVYKIINDVSIAQSVFIGICDENNKIIFADNEDMIGKYTDRGFDIVWKGNNYKIYADIPTPGWKLVAVISENSLCGSYILPVVLILVIIGVVLFAIMLIILLYIVFSKNFIKRISGMVSEFETNGGGEEVLDNRLEEILNNYKDMIAQKYRNEILLKEAELKSLQAQINPHFLYNTLDSINWLVKQDDNKGAEKMLNDLAGYFRFSLSKSKDIVTIENEMDIADSYMRIQKHRFGNKFSYETHIDDAVLAYKIPKLTMQPFLENVLLHGINSETGKICNIIVSAIEEDDYIEICISDNGKGMTEDQIKKLFDDCGGYGVYNVNRRLRLFSDDCTVCGVEVRSVPNKYTTVILRIKKIL